MSTSRQMKTQTIEGAGNLVRGGKMLTQDWTECGRVTAN